MCQNLDLNNIATLLSHSKFYVIAGKKLFGEESGNAKLSISSM